MDRIYNEQIELINNDNKKGCPVKCLGMTFENDESRRKYFTEELRERLSELRKIEGFPIGEDEDILTLSNPPYYTACPNPFIPDFVANWEAEKKKLYGDIEEDYHKEPLSMDVVEGKNDQLYGIPSYYTKVPPKAILRYILHYTKPGDIILDCFSGTGMTGIAAKFCDNKRLLENAGYRVDKSNNILYKDKIISKLGTRNSILVDLSPYAAFVSATMNNKSIIDSFDTDKHSLTKYIKNEISPLYTTDWNGTQTEFDYAVWSDWSSCDECGYVYRIFDLVIDWENSVMRKVIICPNCGVEIETEGLSKVFENEWDSWISSSVRKAKSSLVMLSRLIGNRSDRKKSSEDDEKKAHIVDELKVNYSPKELTYSHMTHERNNLPKYWGITHIHQFYTKRNYYALDGIITHCIKERNYTGVFCALSIIENNATKRNRFYVDKRREKGSPIGPLSNTLYVPTIQIETNIGKKVLERMGDIEKVKSSWPNGYSVVSNQSATDLAKIGDSTIDFIFTDPPFGGNINYSEQSVLPEWWLKVFTNNKEEAITNTVQKKDVRSYQYLMTKCFSEYYRVLKPNHWMVVEFHNSSNYIWNCIQQALERAGFIVASVNLLDKKQDTLHQDHKASAVNKDLAITVYKPSAELESRFKSEAGTDQGVWEFVRNHLSQLPVFTNDKIAVMSERTKIVLFDRMVAFHIQRGAAIPISAADFYSGLQQKFVERDDMYFLSEQVFEYDKKKASTNDIVQMQLFISDERSAIDWLRNRLKNKPQSFQELHPDFLREINAWGKYDQPLELSVLLEQNFIQYQGLEPVPSQIHSYLSSNFKDLRELDKEDPRLKAKAKNRWYVPDPNKQSDLEKLREKALLREFSSYLEEINSSKKKLKQFRLEAIRAGFKKAWSDKDFKTIVDVGSKIPENVLQEDDKLLMYYDNAQIRLGL